MSASEKLKRLSFWQWRKVIREVVAVVEAAENQKREAYGMPLTAAAMDVALAALDEALA